MENILFVAVSQSMAEIAAKVISKLGLQIPIIVRTMDESEAVVKSNPNVEVFISRGRTAKFLEQFSGKPSVYITCSTADILEPVQKLTEEGINKIAVMASPLLIGEDSYDFKIADTDVYMRPFEVDELDKIAYQLHNKGVNGVVAGAIDRKVTEKYGMKVQPLDTQASSIRRAVEEAVRIVRAKEIQRMQEREKVEEIHKNATKLYAAIEEAASAVEELASSSEELAATSQETANTALKAFEEVTNTSEILDIIRQVAKQINMLGLNAAIEASRAGEYGRGFTVVAKEVRKLAAESNTSAGEIDSMLNKFRNSVEFVMQNVEQSNAITQEQAKANQNIAHMLDRLRDVGKTLMDMAERK